MATVPADTNLSLGKLGRATNVDNSDYTSETSLNSSARDSGTGAVSMSQFYIGSVDDSLSGYQYVDEQTNETYTMTFGNENTLFQSRIAARHDNFTWGTTNGSLFAPVSNQDYTAQFNAGTIAEAANTGFISKSFEANIVTGGHDFGAWENTGNLTHWVESDTNVIELVDVSSDAGFTKAPSGSNPYMVKFKVQDGSIRQTMTVKGNSTYEIVAHASASNPGVDNIDIEISGSFHQSTYRGIAGGGQWNKFRQDFYTSGSSGASSQLQLKFTQVSHSAGVLLDSVFVRRWEGANFSDQSVTINGKFHEDGQSDGFNDHATRYNTSITKEVEIQDTYGGLSSACFLPGTLIQMADGSSEYIENLNVGDEVLSLDLPGLPDEDLGRDVWMPYTLRQMSDDELSELFTKHKSTAKIESLFYDYEDGYYNINSGDINVTKAHEFWVFQDGLWRWKRANELEVGNLLYSFIGEIKPIESIELVEGEVEVIQFDVEPLDVYFAAGVLVHNKGTDSDPA